MAWYTLGDTANYCLEYFVYRKIKSNQIESLLYNDKLGEFVLNDSSKRILIGLLMVNMYDMKHYYSYLSAACSILSVHILS